MQSRRDHMQAYQFSTSRLVHSLTAGEPGVGEPPFRRAQFGTVLGTVLAALLSGGAVVFGLVSPAPSTAWRANGSIVVEKETGTRYLYLGGELRPTANYASALLAAASGSTVQYVAHSALAAVPVGAPIGIPGAPDALPAAANLLPADWALCLRPGGGAPVLDLAPAGHTAAVPAAKRILVAGPAVAGQPALEYVLWDAKKYPLPDPAALSALGLGNATPTPAGAPWLAAFPTGPALTPAVIPDAGAPGPQLAGRPTKVGQLFQAGAGGVEQFYVLRADGLAPLTRTEVALLSAVPGYGAPTPVSPSNLASVPVSPDDSLLSRLPDLMSGTDFTGDGSALCAQQASPGAAAATHLVTENAANVAADPGVVLPNGSGMLVQPAQTPAEAGSLSTLTYLVAGDGEKFLIDGGDALQDLGYSSATVHVLPAGLLALIPSGPTLSVARARAATPWG
jgi:type VII secretion protein EccB